MQALQVRAPARKIPMPLIQLESSQVPDGRSPPENSGDVQAADIKVVVGSLPTTAGHQILTVVSIFRASRGTDRARI